MSQGERDGFGSLAGREPARTEPNESSVLAKQPTLDRAICKRSLRIKHENALDGLMIVSGPCNFMQRVNIFHVS